MFFPLAIWDITLYESSDNFLDLFPPYRQNYDSKSLMQVAYCHPLNQQKIFSSPRTNTNRRNADDSNSCLNQELTERKKSESTVIPLTFRKCLVKKPCVQSNQGMGELCTDHVPGTGYEMRTKRCWMRSAREKSMVFRAIPFFHRIDCTMSAPKHNILV